MRTQPKYKKKGGTACSVNKPLQLPLNGETLNTFQSLSDGLEKRKIR